MRIPCTIKLTCDRKWWARTVGGALETVEAVGMTREEALEKLRAAIIERLEWSPSSLAATDSIELDVREQTASPWRGSVF